MTKFRNRGARLALALGVGGALLLGTGGSAMADGTLTPEQQCVSLQDSPNSYQRCLKAYTGSTPEEMARAAGDPRYAPSAHPAQTAAPKSTQQKATSKKAPAKKSVKTPSRSESKSKMKH